MSETNTKRGRLNTVIGEVTSDKMDKTIAVRIYRLVKHKRYGKYIRKSSVFKAHDADNSAKLGDKVEISETRALSKTKRWKLKQIIDKAIQA